MLRIGPAGWAYKDWAGIVYPSGLKRTEQLPYLAQFFDVLEINTSFYSPLAPGLAEAWVKKISGFPRFRFTAKIWKTITHAQQRDTKDDNLIRESFAPLLQAGKLGALLLQFPSSFHYTPQNARYIADLRSRFEEFPLVLEVRHSTWNDVGVLSLLEELQLGLCNIDQPLFRKSLGPGASTVGPIGYVRLHGRNYSNWWRENSHVGERYDYLYSVEELEPWIDRIRVVDQHATDTYVVTNNHYLGKAVVNAVELIGVLNGKPSAVPGNLLAQYPELIPFSAAAEKRESGDEQQLGLSFD